MPPHSLESPAKKQSKWSPEEDALIIELRGSGMKWDDISKKLPGRSAISCRLHYQNYLERRSEWDEERKNKLARLYER
jgi:Myb-like DNA-binding domain